MPPVRPQLSITLPRNFTFHYTDGQPPKTPEREQHQVRQPPPPIYRLRRRPRQDLALFGAQSPLFSDIQSHDIPVPTVEAPERIHNTRPSLPQRASEPAEGYLAPASTYRQMASPRTPTTPTAQLTSLHGHGASKPGWRDNAKPYAGKDLSRPVSSCSNSSDSSESSGGTWRSFPSLGGSCTTPDSEAPEPFSLPSSMKGKAKLTSALGTGGLLLNEKELQSKASGKHKKALWTEKMDSHLWATYQIYLQDPTVTPFKTLPGTAPPIGVCYRVAREAKRTWRMKNHSLDTISETEKTGDQSEWDKAGNSSGQKETDGQINSPDTITAGTSGSNTPTAPTTKQSQWPQSARATRRRLIDLCKKKPSIAPHYQRLMRSPSPVESQTPSSRSRYQRFRTPPNRRANAALFSTRDIALSLTTSTSDTMQPDGALAQLARGDLSSTEEQRNEEWFNTPVNATSESNMSSAQEGLGIDGLEEEPGLPRLGSPFGYHTWGPSQSRAHFRPSTPRTQSDHFASQIPTLRSPLQLQQPLPLPPALKRRAQHLLEEELSPGGTDIGRNTLEDMFRAPAESSHRRVRSRGFSLGDVMGGGRLSSMFTPPTLFDQMTSSEFAQTATFGSDITPPLPPPSLNRLGSPFSFTEPNSNPTGLSRHGQSSSNTFPRSSSYGLNFASSIDERLSELNEDEATKASKKRTKN